ncbi:MAG: DEAD/DEAH box helicase [Alistipes sp.]|nr:DEAD/DEAH box helicase [Alistipes sp.]
MARFFWPILALFSCNEIEIETAIGNRADAVVVARDRGRKIAILAEQAAAIESVEKFLAARRFQGFLLHGVTGSGKTQVYIELAKITRRLGRRVIILVPEIALTSQIVSNFKAHFADVAVIHSRLSVAERSDTFHKIRGGEVGIVIGARSALFTPMENVGLIVVDEEQDSSYKQNNFFPRYHGVVVAEEFAKFHEAAVVFGSATPSMKIFIGRNAAS